MQAVALVVGPEQHGIVRHGLAVAAAGEVALARDTAAAVALATARPGTVVVAEFADRLFGVTAEAAGDSWRAAAGAVHDAGGRLVASLHDVPAAGDSPLSRRRAALYRAVVETSDAVLTMSEVDRERLAALGIRPSRLAVLPLPVPPVVGRPPLPASADSVTVLGFVYPGKGHEDLVAALAARPAWRDLPLVCAGRASDGHDDLVRELRARHAALTVTGFVPDKALAPLLQAATVPVAPNRVVGSSASIATWWAHGRRPLAPVSPLVVELAAADPGALTVYGTTAELADAIGHALADPASTWLAPGVTPGRSTAETAACRAGLLRAWFG